MMSPMIQKKRIRNLESNIGFIEDGATVAIGIKNPRRYQDIFEEIGFNQTLDVGDSVLPSVSLGPISKFNAEGKYIKHRDKPMETAYRQIEWHWLEWHGRDQVANSRLVDVPYERYPRTFIPPPSIEITVLNSITGEFVILSPFIEYTVDNKEYLKHAINLFLEIFGECHFYTEDLNEIIRAPVHRLNWTILPPGPMTWEQLLKELDPLIQSVKKGKRPFLLHRLITINEFGPNPCYQGIGGFNGYIIFAFPSKNLYVCDSAYYGNATYVFEENWEELSKKTKAEILDRNLQKDRIIHSAISWERRIKELLS